MSVRKNLILAAAGVVAMGATSLTLAGGGDSMAAPVAQPAPQFQRFAYAELGGGYTMTDYAYNALPDHNGGFGFGGDVGYQFMPNFALEIGGGSIPKFTNNSSKDVTSWFTYAAGRINANINEQIGVFGKAGAMYRSVKVDGDSNGSHTYWKPIVGTGVSYDVMANLYVTVQYLYLFEDTNNGTSQNSQNSKNAAKHDAQVISLNLGYKMNM